ncbi:MAG: glycosyltransferase family 1 protein [Lachnospiraceae bacterium]
MKQIKVLFFVDRLLVGGIQTFIRNVVENIDKNRVEVELLTLDDGKDYDYQMYFQSLGISVHKLQGIWIHSVFDYSRYEKALSAFFKEHHYDVIHMHASSKNYPLLKVAKKFQIKVRIAHSHNTGFQTKNKIKITVGNYFKGKLKKYATDYFACSKKAGEWLFPKEDVVVIYNGINLKRFAFDSKKRKEIRDELDIDMQTTLFGHVGRFTNQKNHLFLIDIFSEIHQVQKETKLLLLGNGSLMEDVKIKVKELNLENVVIFAGFKNNASDYFQGMDVFLLPSLYEGLPIVLLEAQASGLPSFTSNTVTFESKITDLVTFVELNQTPKYWADQILKKDLIRQDGTEDIIKNGYTIKQTCEFLIEYYEKEVKND